MDSKVKITIFNEEGKSYTIKCSKAANYSELIKFMKDNQITKLNNFIINFQGRNYDGKNTSFLFIIYYIIFLYY